MLYIIIIHLYWNLTFYHCFFLQRCVLAMDGFSFSSCCVVYMYLVHIYLNNHNNLFCIDHCTHIYLLSLMILNTCNIVIHNHWKLYNYIIYGTSELSTAAWQVWSPVVLCWVRLLSRVSWSHWLSLSGPWWMSESGEREVHTIYYTTADHINNFND